MPQKKKMSWGDSILEVLKDADEPMHYADIAEQVGERGLRKLDANAPYSVVATISSSMSEEGSESPFVRVSRGYYALRSALSAAAEPDEQLEQPITSYGLFWRRKAVKWRNAEPKILGASSTDAPMVDFYSQHGVYILYDAAHRPVYVGMSGTSIGDRLRSHTKGKFRGRWKSFSWFGFREVKENGKLGKAVSLNVSTSDLAELLEAVLIEVTEPPLNRQKGKGLSGTEYFPPED